MQWIGIDGPGMFLAPAAPGLFVVLVFVVGLKEVPRSREEVGPMRIRDIFSALWIPPFEIQ
ncbi:hypothetical protein [Arthrobacter nitrophenolicus]|uniref:Uncharacterized protein n=1 Tax=Arthrobacter nitrophenolicus TaxID=683150 RepID=A0A4V3B0Q6_9MICC|nr:hypothetical protein [Arthrobacter nitrophenolicus]TDL33968.1 hypothetical protein E2R57_15750 [Arthrobacter nitrophenolicus]